MEHHTLYTTDYSSQRETKVRLAVWWHHSQSAQIRRTREQLRRQGNQVVVAQIPGWAWGSNNTNQVHTGCNWKGDKAEHGLETTGTLFKHRSTVAELYVRLRGATPNVHSGRFVCALQNNQIKAVGRRENHGLAPTRQASRDEFTGAAPTRDGYHVGQRGPYNVCRDCRSSNNPAGRVESSLKSNCLVAEQQERGVEGREGTYKKQFSRQLDWRVGGQNVSNKH